MLTYELKKAPGVPLYEALYRCIREDILSGKLQPGQKLPSKRALSANLEVSKITVEAAYQQLLSEGFIRSRERSGYFVEQVERVAPKTVTARPPEIRTDNLVDLTGNGPAQFPFSVWSKLQREVVLDLGEQLLQPLPNLGVWELRQAISQHLAQFRGMQVDPEHILVGAGTDFLYNLLIQLLGRELTYGVEEPGYGKIRRIYAAAGAHCISVPMDAEGVDPDALSGAQVLHISPSHHFPTGRITSLQRRQALLKKGIYIIEDDYDSEFRFDAHPMPTMQSLDGTGKVIYMNTFSKTLAPSIRISYMVLPGELMGQFRQRLGFYSCTVPSFEQYTLARFIQRGYYEKHINRMRKVYRGRRNRVLQSIGKFRFAHKAQILEENAGLHFLLRVDTPMTDRELTEYCRRLGLRIRCLSEYYHGYVPEEVKGHLVINYSGLTEESLRRLETILESI